ncbi:MAG: DNA starvation/stationary phase protection protein [Bacteroidales bacterium]|nr:DNA starvation/stationary phase protection protein [Bacteroidales bacterium]
MKNQIGLNENYTDSMVGKLNVFLSNIQIFYANVRGFHWNITGKQFFMLHEKFEELYDSLNEKADEVAERILMLGGKPENLYSKYISAASIKEKDGISSAEETVKEVLEGLKTLLAEEKKIISVASENHDEGTVNLLSGFIDEQEKMIWMYGAFLK